MTNLGAVFILLLSVVAPPFASADSSTPAQPLHTSTAASDQSRELFKNLDLGLVGKAYAAECKDEGELCKTNAECCPGLECSGDPQTTCRPQE